MSSGPDEPDDLSARVDALEQAVAEQRETLEHLQDELRALRSALSDSETPDPPSVEGSPAETSPSPDDSPATPGSRVAPLLRRLVSWAGLRSEDWLNYVGIGLFLFGVAFLLRYTVEQGWVGPPVRVGLGALLGTGLLGSGLRLSRSRRHLRQVLLGGSGATFYATLFAAHQLYGLVSYVAAFAGMGVVTVVLGILAVRQDEPILGIVGVLGGLGTPFLLYTETGGLPGLSLYLCVVLVGACAVYGSRGWRTLLYATVAGGWTAFGVAVLRVAVADPPPPDRWALQLGIAAAWLLLAGTPVLRALLRRSAPGRRSGALRPGWIHSLVGERRSAFGLITASPFLAVALTRLLWTAPEETWVLVAGLGAAIYGGAYVGLRRVPLPGYAPAHGLVAAVLAAYGLAEGLGGAALLVAWSVEGLLLLAWAARLDEAALRRAGHALFAVVAVGLTARLTDGSGGTPPLVTAGALSELAVLSLAAAAATAVRPSWLRWGYRGAALVGWLGWTAHELMPLHDGPAYTSLFWGATAAALLVAGARVDRRSLQIGGLAVLAAFVAKLFLVDLASLPPLWRIALFLGFGAAFLGISYLLPGLLPTPGGGTSARDG